MRVLVTGNLGYIGSVLTGFLAVEGFEVWGYDTGYYEECLFGSFPSPPVSKQIRKDIRDVSPGDLEHVDAIVHLAALSNDPTGEINPLLTEAINYRSSVRLANTAREAGVSRFVFASSCSIYGRSDGSALTEITPFNPQTAYARSKVDTEAKLSEMADDSFCPVFLRNATAYGLSPRLRFDLAVNNLTGWAFTTGCVKLLSDGRAWRPMVHVEDISRACAAALTAPDDRVHNQAINIGDEAENYQIREIATMVAEIVPNSTVTFAEGASADSRSYNVSFDKLHRVFPDLKLKWSVRAGIEQLYEAFRSQSLSFDRFESRDFTRLKQLKHLIDKRRVDNDLRWQLDSSRIAS